MDARIRYTKMIIRQALIDLLSDRPISKITVKAICEKADVNRATFYRYYDNQFDLLEKTEKELLSDLITNIQAPLKEGKEDLKEGTIAVFAHVYKTVINHICENRELYILLFSSNGDEKFCKELFSICYGDNIKIIHNRFPDMSLAKQEWLYYFIAEGCDGILKNWIKNGMRESADEIVEFTMTLIRGINTQDY